MRGLGLIVGYVLGNATARKWCINNLKKASVVLDNEIKKTPLYGLCSSIIKGNGDDNKKDSECLDNKKGD